MINSYNVRRKLVRIVIVKYEQKKCKFSPKPIVYTAILNANCNKLKVNGRKIDNNPLFLVNYRLTVPRDFEQEDNMSSLRRPFSFNISY